MKKKKSEKSGRYVIGSITQTAFIIAVMFLMAVSILADEQAITGSKIFSHQEVFKTLNSLAPPTFTAAPYADDFVVTGSEVVLGGEHFFPSNGDGTFGLRSNIPGLNVVDGMDVADMDGDGDNDILIGDGETSEVYLYTNDGAGTFTTSVVATGVSSGGFCTNLRVGDFNRDGRMDFVVGDNRVRNGMFVYLQTGPGTFTKVLPGLDIDTWSTVGGNSLFGVAVGDVDGDSHLDILLLGYHGIGAGQVRFYEGDGSGAMAPSIELFNIGTDFGVLGVNGLALFDLEGDGDLDIIAGGGDSGTHYIYTNDGSGNFTQPTGFVFDVDAQTGIDRCDLDGDGDHDLVVAAFGPESFFYVENLGGTLATPVLVSTLNGPSIGIGAPEISERMLIVALDIKPQTCPNPLNVKSKGVLPVAILGSEDLDVNTIDIASVRLGGVAPIRSNLEDVATPVEDGNECECTTEGPDGYMDLTLKFDTQEIVATLGEVNHKDELSFTLEGALFEELSGTPIQGTDCITIRGKHKPINDADINKDGVVDAVDFAILVENWLQLSVIED